MHIFVTTIGNIEKLTSERWVLTRVLVSQHNTHGNGQRVPPTTLDTWERVEKHYDSFCRQWTQADKGFGEYSSSASRTLVKTLVNVINEADRRESLTDDTKYKKNDKQSRWTDFEKRSEKYLWTSPFFVAHEVEAYRAIRELQEYTKGRGWSTDENLGEILGDQELENRKQISLQFLQEVRDSYRDEGTRLAEPDSKESQEKDSDQMVYQAVPSRKAKIYDGYEEIDWAAGRRRRA